MKSKTIEYSHLNALDKQGFYIRSQVMTLGETREVLKVIHFSMDFTFVALPKAFESPVAGIMSCLVEGDVVARWRDSG